MLAYEKSEADIMKREPRDPNHDKLVNRRSVTLTYPNSSHSHTKIYM